MGVSRYIERNSTRVWRVCSGRAPRAFVPLSVSMSVLCRCCSLAVRFEYGGRLQAEVNNWNGLFWATPSGYGPSGRSVYDYAPDTA